MKESKNYFLKIFFFGFLLLFNILWAQSIKVVIPLTEPYAFYDSSKKLVGFDIDLLHYLESKGLHFEIDHAPFMDALFRLDSGFYDMAMGGIYITKYRQKKFLFTSPYIYTGIVVMSFDKITNYHELEGMRIGVKRGATGEKLARSLQTKYSFKIILFNNSLDQLNALRERNIDALITDYYNALYYINKFSLTNCHFFPPDKFLEMNQVGLAFNKKKSDLRQLINSYLKDYITSQEFNQSHRKWFGIPYRQALKKRNPRNTIISLFLLVLLLLVLVFLFYLLKKVTKELKIKKFKEKQILEIATIYTELFRHVPEGIFIFTWKEDKEPVLLVNNHYASTIIEKIKEHTLMNFIEIKNLINIIDSHLPLDFMNEILKEKRFISKNIHLGKLHFNIITFSLPNDIYALVIKDISSEEFYKEKLKESQKKYRIAFHSLGEGLIWIEKDKIKEINPSAIQILNLGNKKILGKSIVDIFPLELWKLIQKRIKEQEIIQTEFSYPISNGTNKMIHITVTSMELQKINYLILLRDITDEKMQLEKINYLASFKNNILTSMPSSIFALDEIGQVVEVNKFALDFWSLNENELDGHKLWEVVPELSIFKGYFEKVKTTGEEISLYKVLLYRKKEKIFLNVWLYPIMVNQKLIVILKHDDITKEVQIDQQLKQAQKMEIIGELAGSLVHDFNNILGAIDGTLSVFDAELKMGKEVSKEKLEKRIRNMKISTSRARELIQRLLVLGRGYESKKEIIDINDVIKESISIIKSILPKNVKLNLKLPPFPIFILGDSLNIQQIIINLIKNAIDAFENKNGEISLQLQFLSDVKKVAFLEKERAWLHLSVSDNGPGIPEEIQEKIFEPFFSTKPKGKGTGLGLSIVYNLIKEMGGHVELKSIPGEGTTFHIYIPRVEEEKIKDYFSREKEEIPHGSGRILVVDDDEVIRVVSQNLLEMSGFKVEQAEDGLEALQKFSQDPNKYDAIVMDLIMPKMNGYEAFFEIKKIKQQIPIIVATAFKHDKLAQELLQNGAAKLIQKPFTRKEIVTAVINSIEQRN